MAAFAPMQSIGAMPQTPPWWTGAQTIGQPQTQSGAHTPNAPNAPQPAGYPGMLGSPQAGQPQQGVTPTLGGPQVSTNGSLTSQPTVPQVAYAQNPQLPVQAYTQQVDQSLAPTFQQQDQALTEQLAGQGILNSGAASNQLQTLTGEQGAAVAADVAPLLQQGNAEASTTSLANAGALNNASLAGYAGGLSTYQLGQNLGNTDALANQNTQTTYDLANLGALNSNQLAQMGYSNQDYLTILQDMYGIQSSGQNAGNTVSIGSVPTGTSAYLNGQNSVTGSAAGVGAGSLGTPQYDSNGNLVTYTNGTPTFNEGDSYNVDTSQLPNPTINDPTFSTINFTGQIPSIP